jgi:cytosine/uracil/thiamine/allantoin permease
MHADRAAVLARAPHRAKDARTNPKAIIALVVAILPVVPGFIRAATTPGGVVAIPNLFDQLYTYAWFVTFALSAAIYLLLMGKSARR